MLDANLTKFMMRTSGRLPRDFGLTRAASAYFRSEMSFLEIMNFERGRAVAFTERKLNNLTGEAIFEKKNEKLCCKCLLLQLLEYLI